MKKILNLVVACLTLALAGCGGGSKQAAKPVDTVPKTYTFTITDVSGPSYHIEYTGGYLVYSAALPGQKSKPPLHRTPSPEQWEEFRHQMDRLKVWQWKPNYGNHSYISGTQWSLDLTYSDHSIHSEGHRDFPDNYDGYLKAVGNLLGTWQIN
jgi:hypothetical protein